MAHLHFKRKWSHHTSIKSRSETNLKTELTLPEAMLSGHCQVPDAKCHKTDDGCALGCSSSDHWCSRERVQTACSMAPEFCLLFISCQIQTQTLSLSSMLELSPLTTGPWALLLLHESSPDVLPTFQPPASSLLLALFWIPRADNSTHSKLWWHGSSCHVSEVTKGITILGFRLLDFQISSCCCSLSGSNDEGAYQSSGSSGSA
jgi:hypothetical protein